MKQATLALRSATTADLPALGRLGALLVRTHHDFDGERFIPASPRTEHGYASWFGSQLENPETVILVAVQNGEVLGYSYSGIEGPDYMSLRGPAGVLHDCLGRDATVRLRADLFVELPLNLRVKGTVCEQPKLPEPCVHPRAASRVRSSTTGPAPYAFSDYRRLHPDQ